MSDTLMREQPILIRTAAKAVRKSEKYVREQYVDSLKVRAFRIGGTDAHPRLRIYLSELQAAIERDAVWVPPGFTQQQVRRRRRSSAAIHPAAAAM